MPTQQKSPAVAEPTRVQIDSSKIPRFPYVVVHRNPRTNQLTPVATFLYKSHAGALIRQLQATNPDARDQFEIKEIAHY
ncbi:hypothetical protein IQ265_12710 [Nodosilinea sp. LEGE 06152]|uniref:hypothetical protein n=1 Tax=Nodosilinea sp. LEGE 06152 TaxID=2777966 RepID=UPI0018804CF4|nr:hypothetical protein [Nodosilinea sp. LEGE 06152]MBE9157680.1 hypothetical protein [Nodosilinea sp. LEGE 06152]